MDVIHFHFPKPKKPQIFKCMSAWATLSKWLLFQVRYLLLWAAFCLTRMIKLLPLQWNPRMGVDFGFFPLSNGHYIPCIYFVINAPKPVVTMRSPIMQARPGVQSFSVLLACLMFPFSLTFCSYRFCSSVAGEWGHSRAAGAAISTYNLQYCAARLQENTGAGLSNGLDTQYVFWLITFCTNMFHSAAFSRSNGDCRRVYNLSYDAI